VAQPAGTTALTIIMTTIIRGHEEILTVTITQPVTGFATGPQPGCSGHHQSGNDEPD
jgi:hypothetical protein